FYILPSSYVLGINHYYSLCTTSTVPFPVEPPPRPSFASSLSLPPALLQRSSSSAVRTAHNSGYQPEDLDMSCAVLLPRKQGAAEEEEGNKQEERMG
ncbi:hypothetical protein EJB05_01983, partial [Eragrostis curvula]